MKDDKAACKECGCRTGGGEFCYNHAPYMVYPKADGSFLSDRNGRHRVSFEAPPSASSRPSGWQPPSTREVEELRGTLTSYATYERILQRLDNALMFEQIAKFIARCVPPGSDLPAPAPCLNPDYCGTADANTICANCLPAAAAPAPGDTAPHGAGNKMKQAYAADAAEMFLAADGSMMCEKHPGREWPHDDCVGPGMPWVISGRTLIAEVLLPHASNCPVWVNEECRCVTGGGKR